MGRNAKLKKIRREVSSHPLSSPEEKTLLDATEFVNQLQEEGYSLKEIQRCPVLPEKTVKPKL